MLILYGVALLQVYMYFVTYDEDHIVLKGLVFLVWTFASVHTVFVCIGTYHFDILTYSRPELVVAGEWSALATISAGVVVCFLVQMQVVLRKDAVLHRSQKLVSRCTYISSMSQLIKATQLSEYVRTSESFDPGSLLKDLVISPLSEALFDPEKIKGATYIAMIPLFAIRVVSDSFTSISLCVILYDSQPTFSRQVWNKRLHRFALTRPWQINQTRQDAHHVRDEQICYDYAIIAQTIILMIEPGSVWAMSMDIVNVQIYVNSFMSILNSRNYLCEIGSGNQASGGGPISLSMVHFNPATDAQGRSMTISANRETEFDHDFSQNPKTIHESYSMSKLEPVRHLV
ncbi:hypothetical protein C8J56DRAFT_1058608 [Mycena floridula]|nr:hypothetical protein C8J56DRAFT_1058608 [Mycena floridula]